MKPPLSIRTLARILPLLLLVLTIPKVGAGQPTSGNVPSLAPQIREGLSQAAGNTRLLPWQRDFMLSLASGREASAPVSPANVTRAARASATIPGGAWSEIFLVARFSHSAIYDPVRDRMVVFGGDACYHYFNDVWALSLVGTPTWTELAPICTPPSARGGHSAIYDPVRDRMIVFGGHDDSGESSVYYDDVWTLSLGGTSGWVQLSPSGTPPSARAGHSAIYDPVRDRMVVFGGYSQDPNDHDFSDVWALSLAGTPTWTQLAPTEGPPTAREQHSAIYDPVRDRMVVFGGWLHTSPWYLDDVWSLSLGSTPAWTQLAPTGTPPGALYGHSAVYDPVRDRMVMFGGFHCYSPIGDRNDVWELSLAGTSAWTQLAPTGMPPSERHSHSAIYDPVRDQMVVFGGFGGVGSGNGAWGLSLTSTPAWAQLTPVSSTPPAPRGSHSAIYDPARDRMVVFGGVETESHYFNDVWTLSLADTSAWAQLAPTGTPPSARYSHSAIYDPVRDQVVVFGGKDAFSTQNDVWTLSLAGTPTWTRLLPTGTWPSGRYSHSAIYDPVRDWMIVFGGRIPNESSFNDVWALSLAGTQAWAQLAPTGTPPSARYSHSAIYDPVYDRMVVFGGHVYSSGRACNDAYGLWLAGTPAWTQLETTGAPPAVRQNHSAIYDPVRDRMVVFGGSCFGYDVWALVWRRLAGIGDPVTSPLAGYLHPPTPNPSCGTASVNYSIARGGRVQLAVFDVSGRLVRRLVDGERRAGAETAVWNGTDEFGAKVRSGMYFVRLAGPQIRETRKLILLK